MLKILIDPDKGHISIEAGDAPVSQIASELCEAAHEIYNTIYANDKIEAAFFRAYICAGMTAKGAPTWKIDHDPGRKAECYTVAVPPEAEKAPEGDNADA